MFIRPVAKNSKNSKPPSSGRKSFTASKTTNPLSDILTLHKAIGNQAVQRLIKSGFLQTKLNVGKTNDIHEQEADRVAEQVMLMPDLSKAQREGRSEYNRAPSIQRMCTECEEELHGQAQDSELGILEQGYPSEKGLDIQKEGVQIQRICTECEEELRRQPIEGVEKLQMQPMEDEEEKKMRRQPVDGEEEEELQRQTMLEEEEEKPIMAKGLSEEPGQLDENIDTRLSSSKVGGNPLSSEVKSFMEPRFGFKFDDVRVHNGSAAARSAKHIGAAAYTSGNDIYFGAGKYLPKTMEGKELIAHELVHVVQQTKGRMKKPLNDNASNNHYENKAGRVTEDVLRMPESNGKKKITSSISSYNHSAVQLVPNVTAVVAPAELAAGRGRTARARATAGRGITIDWSIQGNARGATIAGRGRSATITAPAGSTGGPITVRAADAADATDFADAVVNLVEIQQPTFVFAPAMPAFAPANTMDASVCNNTATANAVTVPAGRAVQWSIRGNRRGATIDPGTGVINPSATQSGNITVRATDTALRDALADQVLTIRAHPTGIRRTLNTGAIPPAAGGPYGAVYDHIFNSSGGSLLNVDVSERVFCGNDPFNFCPGLLPIAPGPPNVWILTAAGRMVGDFMLTGSGLPGINVNLFLPSPPNPGLPQVLDTPQILYWRSLQCSPGAAAAAAAGDHWVPFVNVPITATLLRRGANFRFVTRNNRVPHDEPYVGPALAAAPPAAGSVCPAGTSVSRVSLTPSVLAADTAATSIATARVRPAATALQWTFQGLNFGAVFVNPAPGAGNPAVVTAGNIAGRVTIRAADVANPGCFAEGRLRLEQVHVGPIRLRPGAIPAGGDMRARATVQTRPGRRDVNWTIQGPNLGSVIVRNTDNSATIAAGPQRGRITIRATDQNDATKFSEASLVLS